MSQEEKEKDETECTSSTFSQIEPKFNEKGIDTKAKYFYQSTKNFVRKANYSSV
eukprot:m.271774 g.271774  ORF g.271774 m.271774 type:complete len:54 (+) comp40554_c0_seq4:1993-2154(+)